MWLVIAIIITYHIAARWFMILNSGKPPQAILIDIDPQRIT